MEVTTITPMEAPSSSSAASAPASPAASPAPAHPRHGAPRNPTGQYLAALTIGALGVVYGDIGTSPLYAMKECFNPEHHLAASHDNVLGVLSLITWSLLLVVTLKYLAFVLRADNRGEGGIMALVALSLLGPNRPRGKSMGVLLLCGLFGAALLYGDGMITPAISVLSAVEGLHIATDRFDPYIQHIAIGLIVMLFVAQRWGTAGIGVVFGPITGLWFLAMVALGLPSIIHNPEILKALSPHYGLLFLADNQMLGLIVLGSVFLVTTGGEALYADMGHFGRRPIRIAWFAFVLPALLINYYGQGALVLENPEAIKNPFYMLAPQWAIYPLVGLATCAAIIASQALITGAFSMTRQAIQLGYCPPMRVVQTSSKEIGQIYIPFVNWMLLGSVIMLIIGFKTSGHLAAAYGMACNVTMLVTTILLHIVARRIWHWKFWQAASLTLPLLAIEGGFLVSNGFKFPHGGWFPLAVGGVILFFLLTWKSGRTLLREKMREDKFPLDKLLDSLARNPPATVPGTAIFLTGNANGTPGCLLHNLKHNKVLHERLVFVTVLAEDVPTVNDTDRMSIEEIRPNAHRVLVRYGFSETPDIPAVLAQCATHGLVIKEAQATYFLGRERIIPEPGRSPLHNFRMDLFNWMGKNARSSSDFFQLPPNRVVELGSQVEL